MVGLLIVDLIMISTTKICHGNTKCDCPNCHDDEVNLINVTDIDEDVLKIRNNLKAGINNTHNKNNSGNKLLIDKIKSNRYLPNSIVREICAHCNAQVYTHNPVVICYSCSNIIHYKCASLANYKTDQQSYNWYCPDCQDSEGIHTSNVCRYNPFNNDYTSKNPSHHYDHEPSEYIESLKDISKVLNECTSYTVNEFNHKIKSRNLNKLLSMYFLNVDGNSTNFDSFEVELSRYAIQFSIIGICETNTDSEKKKKKNYML